MIDHVSVAVRDLAAGTGFYEPLLQTIGLSKLVERADTVGFGKRYPEFWINVRKSMASVEPDSGVHICLRTRTRESVDAFYATALENGGVDDGEPGFRPQYSDTYYGAFIRDPDGNRIEAVTFLEKA